MSLEVDDMMNEQQLRSRGLRELADFHDAHPDFPIEGITVRMYQCYPKDLAAAARMLAPAKKSIDEKADGYVNFTRWFGDVKMVVFGSKERMCKRVQIGTKEVPVFEWQCAGFNDKEQHHE